MLPHDKDGDCIGGRILFVSSKRELIDLQKIRPHSHNKDNTLES